jgi:arylsulfatase
MLKPHGYRTYHSGKWHVDGEPTKNGFDHSYCFQDSDRYFSPTSHLEDGVALPPVARDSGYYATTAIADHAVKCLREHAEKFPGQPFFQYVAFTPHFPRALQDDIARTANVPVRLEQIRDRRWRRLKDMESSCDSSAVEREVGPPHDFPAALEKLRERSTDHCRGGADGPAACVSGGQMAVHARWWTGWIGRLGRSWINSAAWGRPRTRWCSSCRITGASGRDHGPG